MTDLKGANCEMACDPNAWKGEGRGASPCSANPGISFFCYFLLPDERFVEGGKGMIAAVLFLPVISMVQDRVVESVRRIMPNLLSKTALFFGFSFPHFATCSRLVIWKPVTASSRGISQSRTSFTPFSFLQNLSCNRATVISGSAARLRIRSAFEIR